MNEQKQNRLVVADAGWGETIPKWILEEIETDRLMYGMCGIIKPGTEIVGDAEVIAYLYTLCLRVPVDHETAEIYIYLTAKLIKRKMGKEALQDFMKEKLEKGLTEYEKTCLNILRQDIYRARGGEIHAPLLDILKELKKEGKYNKEIRK
jgi:hypothetical protein